MNRRLSGALRCAALLSCFLAASAVHAQATRTWVSGGGDDVNPCNRTAPCKTFAGAISKTAAGGQISVLDPGGYGAVTITKSITIDGFGLGASIQNSNGSNAVTILGATGDERVVLRGLQIDGGGTVLGANGVRVRNAASVLIEEVTIQNVAGVGIEIAPETTASTHVVVRRTSIHSAATAVFVNGSNASAVAKLEDVVLADGDNGVVVEPGGSVDARDVRASNFSMSAFAADGGTLSLDGCSATSSGNGVLSRFASALVTLAECSIANNDTGIAVESGGQVHSFGTNRVHDNLANDGPTAEIGHQ